MNFIQRLAWATAGTIALASLYLTSEPTTPGATSSELSETILHLQSAVSIAPSQAKTLRYVPPSRRGTPARTQGGGSRGCEQESTPITLLAPPDHVGLTTQARPQLAWYSAQDSMLPMQITLVEPGVSEPIWETQVATGKAGFNSIQLPDSMPELTPGRRYRWSVTRICNVRRPSSNTYARGWIERVKTVPAIPANSPFSEQIQVMAAAGLWYDAVTQSLTQWKKSDPSDNTLLFSLLEQGGLSSIVTQEQKRSSRKLPAATHAQGN